MPLRDYKCTVCEKVDADVLDASEMTVFPRWCKDCLSVMVRLPAAPAFTISGYSAKNGYSKGRG